MPGRQTSPTAPPRAAADRDPVGAGAVAVAAAAEDVPPPAGAHPPPVAAAPPEPSLEKRPDAIRGMFARVAPVYDLLNHLLSGWLDHVWRRRAAAVIASGPGPALDLCCGTGDQALAVRRRGARVAAADFCLPMVALARRKFGRLRVGAGEAAPPAPMVADALALPLPGDHFRAATVSFGLRNVVALDGALAELARVLRPGGQLVVLEFALPRFPPLRALYLFYFQQLLPRIGRLISGHSSAYSYLPSSVVAFPQRDGLLERFAVAGFGELAWRDLAAGIVCLYSARKLPASAGPDAGQENGSQVTGGMR